MGVAKDVHLLLTIILLALKKLKSNLPIMKIGGTLAIINAVNVTLISPVISPQ